MKIIVISISIFIFGIAGLLNPVRDGFQFFLNPMQYGLSRFARDIKGAVSFFTSLKSIRDDYVKLLEENYDLKSKLLEYSDLKEENRILRDQLKISSEDSFEQRLLLAHVLGNPSDTTNTTYLLDKGTREGIKPGNSVVLGRHLVGVVKEAGAFRSVLELVISPNLILSVKDLQTGTEGLVLGQYGTAIGFSKILPSEQVNEKDTIVTTAKGGKSVPGLIVGEVTFVEQPAAGVLRKAVVNSYLDLANLERVFVILE